MLETIEETYVDRKTYDGKPWPRGPWDSEPDKRQWEDEATGLACLIVRGPSGALCGYVGVPEGHPWHEKPYGEVGDVDVHGGLTFDGFCQEGGHICHKTDAHDRVWWLGFDCAHSFDACPRRDFSESRGFSFAGDGVYRDISYVADEVKKLAQQVAVAS